MAQKPDNKKTAAAAPQPKAAAPAPAGAPKPRPGAAPVRPTLSPSGKELRGIVRIVGRDLKGQATVTQAIQSIKGMGQNVGQVVSVAVLKALNLSPKTMIGELDEAQIDKLEVIIQKPEANGVPKFMLNRQKEVIGGETRHLSGTDLVFAQRQDIDHDKDVQTWRGYRHAYGQKVRGQHTRSTGRTGMTVGVLRKAIVAKAGAAAAAQTGAAAQEKGAAPAAAAAPAKKAEKPAEAKK